MEIRSTLLRLALATGLAVSGSAPAQAHHGAAGYDATDLTTLVGTVTAFEWKNPHALLHVDVTDDRGGVTPWTAETAGLVILVRAGWHREVLKPGDRITVIGRRARNGTPTMILQRLTLPSGDELNSFLPPR